MIAPEQWPLWGNIAAFLMGTAAIGVAGTKLAAFADRLADRTGLGEAVMGGLFLGVATSLSGITASVTAGAVDQPAMAVSNAYGGIAVQTAFLAIADIAWRRINLEHAAASAQNLLQASLLILLIGLVLLVMFGPEVTVFHLHPASILLFVVYGYGFTLVFRAKRDPMWQPTDTDGTVFDEPDEDAQNESLKRLVVLFVVCGAIVLVAGYLVMRTGVGIAAQTGINESIVGGLFVAVSTSLPELVTTVAAVRRGALTLAVGDIVGGNAFDVLFICVADVAYFGGSIYHAAGERAAYIGALALVLNCVLLMGMIYRQKKGPANIGFESVAILALYGGGFVTVALM